LLFAASIAFEGQAGFLLALNAPADS